MYNNLGIHLVIGNPYDIYFLGLIQFKAVAEIKINNL